MEQANANLSWIGNSCILSPFFAWLFAQTTKMVCDLAQTRRIRFQYLVSTGGMPSAHSSMAAGLAVAIGLKVGFGSPLFALALTFAAVTTFDASTVRRAAGLQARLLNQIVDELFHAHHLSQQKLKELLGHTRLEVFMGVLMGTCTAVLVDSWVKLAFGG